MERGPACFECIILAGDRGKSKKILGQNKAFLDIEGMPLINYVVAAVEQVRYLRAITIVGDRARLKGVLDRPGTPVRRLMPITILEQKNNLYQNVWHAFMNTLPEEDRKRLEAGQELSSDVIEHPVFIVSADVPLIRPVEIEAFIEQCDLDNFDYILGLTPEEALVPYYPRGGQLGIRMAYFRLREGCFRQNNVHIVRPLKVKNREYLQKMYDYRYQKEFWNIIKLAWEILRMREGGLRILRYFLLIQATSILSRIGLDLLARLLIRLLPIRAIERNLSRLLRTRFTSVTTTLGGAALDVDNEPDYRAIQKHFREWIDYQDRQAGARESKDGIEA